MPQIKRMLVPTDFSSTSDIAFEYAMDLASREGCAVHVLHVIDDTSVAMAYPDGFYVELPGLRTQLVEEATRRLNEMLAQGRLRGLDATTEVATGRPARVIVDAARRVGSDLIVMGTHGRTGFAHLMLGSVAERVLRAAPCAVLTVRDTARIADVIAAEKATRQQMPSDARQTDDLMETEH